MENREPQDDVEEPEESDEQEPESETEETSEPRQPPDELKIVILLKGSRAMVGVQSPNCDPLFNTFEGNLSAALSHIPALVESANAKWDAHPRNPKANLPEPPPSTTAARSQPAQAKPKSKQPSFF